MRFFIMVELKDLSHAEVDDFVDEEVLDRRGIVIGTLECHWQSAGGSIFLGIKMRGQTTVRVVPGSIAMLDDRRSCIRLASQAPVIRSAPVFNCDEDLRSNLQQASENHFASNPG